ncbi:hypothetical protein B296_00042297 [Ensete ventricosum]|uniref:Uncharacterized protein n=1 Tax=Ensete ventricosum TaxID=4639 RepID=A0A426XYF5_ENSVE|nr:hypothetical protein B296_00042297 [Ensete ventricosum]
MGFYSNGYGAPVAEVLTAPVAYHAIVLHRGFRGPRGRVQSHRIDHIVGPTVRGYRNVTAILTFIISIYFMAAHFPNAMIEKVIPSIYRVLIHGRSINASGELCC